jgi:carbon storage regulator
MLVISRKLGERVFVGEEIVVTVLEVMGNRVRLGIDAPAAMPILREELRQRSEAIRERELEAV